jgi:hypothetical protein
VTAPAHPAASAEATVVAYEELRRHVVAASLHGRDMGWVVLVREGVASWIERAGAGLAPAGLAAARDPGRAAPPVVSPLHVGLVHVLATIALTPRSEAMSP